MVKPVYLFFAFVSMVIVLVVLGLSIFAFNNDAGQSGGPFDKGSSPSLVTTR